MTRPGKDFLMLKDTAVGQENTSHWAADYIGSSDDWCNIPITLKIPRQRLERVHVISRHEQSISCGDRRPLCASDYRVNFLPHVLRYSVSVGLDYWDRRGLLQLPAAMRRVMTQVVPAPKLMNTDWPFVILKRIGGVAIMGGCATCGRKFFTPSTWLQDAFGAEEYLRGKFRAHDCPH